MQYFVKGKKSPPFLYPSGLHVDPISIVNAKQTMRENKSCFLGYSLLHTMKGICIPDAVYVSILPSHTSFLK